MIVMVALILLAQSDIPHVEVDFTTQRAGDWKGKSFAEIIPADTIKRIVLLRQSTFGLNSGLSIGQAEYDAFFAHTLQSKEPAKDWALGGNEGTRAEFMVLTKKGELFRIEIISDGSLEGSPNAIFIFGEGRGARIAVKDFKYPDRKK